MPSTLAASITVGDLGETANSDAPSTAIGPCSQPRYAGIRAVHETMGNMVELW